MIVGIGVVSQTVGYRTVLTLKTMAVFGWDQEGISSFCEEVVFLNI